MGELNHKFREVFKSLETNVSRKIFPTTFMFVSPVSFASISSEKASLGLIMGA
jgi:hypothetical protein